MVMNKWKILKMDLAFSCLVVAFMSTQFLLQTKKTHTVMWETKNKVRSKSDHQLCYLPVAPKRFKRTFIFQTNILP